MLNDARNLQIGCLSLFLILGIATRDWTVRPEIVLVAIATCLSVQWAMIQLQMGRNRQLSPGTSSWKSALITSLGLCLLLRCNYPATMLLAGSLAIASKFACCYGKKHFFNPANFGIIAALLLSEDAWISPGQWGTDWWCLLLFVGLAGMVLGRVGRWETSAIFLLTYAGLTATRQLWLGWSSDIFFHQLASGSLLLFAFFMLTDPRSIPNAALARMVWAAAIALVTFVLQHQFFLAAAPFWALFLLSPVTPWLDEAIAAPRFSWQSVSFGGQR